MNNPNAADSALNPRSSLRSRLRQILPDDTCNRWIFILTAGCVVSTIFSIAVSQIFLSLALAVFLYQRYYGDAPPYQPPPAWRPVLAFMITTTLAVLLSPELAISLKAMKKFFLFLIMFFVFNRFRTFAQVDFVYRCLFVLATVSSVYGILQFPMSDAGHRITGFMGHWMTFSGIELILFTALLTFLLYYYKEALWAIPMLAVVSLALLLSLTRSAWVGVFFSSVVSVAFKRTRLLIAIPIILVLTLVLSPRQILERAKTLLTLEDRAIEVRFNMIRTGIHMIKAHPLIGVGPNRISRVAYDYGADQTVAPWYYVHLHNNVLQLAAERGIPCLLAWLWLIFTLFRDYFRMARRISIRDKRSYPLAVAFSSLIAILIAGLFEYNFGDSEVIMLLFFVLTAPYVVDREVRSQAAVS